MFNSYLNVHENKLHGKHIRDTYTFFYIHLNWLVIYANCFRHICVCVCVLPQQNDLEWFLWLQPVFYCLLNLLTMWFSANVYARTHIHTYSLSTIHIPNTLIHTFWATDANQLPMRKRIILWKQTLCRQCDTEWVRVCDKMERKMRQRRREHDYELGWKKGWQGRRDSSIRM